MTHRTYKAKSGAMQFAPVVNADELETLRDTGFCVGCGADAEGVEPDARKYVCEACGASKVYGIEELVIMGLCTVKEGAL